MIERAIVNVQTGRDVLEPGTFVHQMPQPCYMNDQCVLPHYSPATCCWRSWMFECCNDDTLR